MTEIKNPITPDKFDAVLFDLDGVITDTARMHAACWKVMFNTYMKRRAEKSGEEFIPFEIETDYLSYVDGKPRYDGVRDFLNSRNITLEDGSPDSLATEESICGLGNRKNELVNLRVQMHGVNIYQSSVDFVNYLIVSGIKTAIVSSSANCKTILNSANISELFPVVIDGLTARERNLNGKPSPDTFLEAAKELNVEPGKTVVVEDAISGVQAGRSGKFGLVIGIARKGNKEELLTNGADIVLKDLGELIPDNN